MKSKKRHQSSSEESEESDASVKSDSSSGSESDDSSASERRHKKKRKRADMSDSESDSDDQKRSKRRKHKKKKKKHGKKKRRSGSVEESQSVEEVSSVSEGEISPKKRRKHKHKHKHSKRARSSSASVIIEEEAPVERRLHSVVKERRGSSVEEHAQPSRTYYPRDYHQSAPVESLERDREVQRFYRGSSKERRYQEQYRLTQEHNDRYQHKSTEKYQTTHYNEEERRQRQYDEYKRNQRYEERRSPPEEYHKRPKEDPYHSREDHRGFNRYNQYEDRRPKRPEYDEARDLRDRRGLPDQDRYREREYPDKRDRFREEGYPSDRPRDARRDRPFRPEQKPIGSQHREQSRSRSPGDRYKAEDRTRRDDRDKGSRFRQERPERPERGERPERPARGERPPRPPRAEPAERPERPERSRSERPERARDAKPRDRKTRFGNVDEKDYSWGKADADKQDGDAPGDKEKPNFGLSGKLTADANTVNGVVIKYTEPEDSKQPKRRWRFYPFKGDKALPILYIHRQSSFLIGRDKKVADIALEHPSISKQHAALQYRATPFARADGSQGRRVRPYVIDLESANGTFVNNKKIEPRRYIELLERDVVKFGFSQREYVLLHENSKDDAQDDDQLEPALATADHIKQERRVKLEAAEDGE